MNVSKIYVLIIAKAQAARAPTVLFRVLYGESSLVVMGFPATHWTSRQLWHQWHAFCPVPSPRWKLCLQCTTLFRQKFCFKSTCHYLCTADKVKLKAEVLHLAQKIQACTGHSFHGSSFVIMVCHYGKFSFKWGAKLIVTVFTQVNLGRRPLSALASRDLGWTQHCMKTLKYGTCPSLCWWEGVLQPSVLAGIS